MFRNLVIVLLLAVCVAPTYAQTCPTIPAESPVAAPDLAAVPPGADAWLLTYQNTFFRGAANHLVATVQTGPNEQKVWFFVNSVPHHTKIYYNRRSRTSSSAPWTWAYTLSPMVLELPQPASVSANSVLYSPVPKYGVGGALYKYAMFLVNQPSSCDGVNAGYAVVSLSNDGTCWTAPVPVQTHGAPSTCAPSMGTALSVEAYDVVDAGNRVYLMGIKGDVPWLVDQANMNESGAVWGWLSPASLHSIVFEPNYNISSSGIVSPFPGFTDEGRFQPYNYFINMAMAWDGVNGYLYLTRGYPFPFDREGSEAPSPVFTTWTELFNPYLPHRLQHVAGCQGGLAAYPNRVQVYYKYLGSLNNFSAIATGTWVLLGDYGNAYGYRFGENAMRTPIGYPQQSIGRDYGAASFLRDGAGGLARTDGGAAWMFGGTQYLSPLSDGPCQATGLERTHLISVPTW